MSDYVTALDELDNDSLLEAGGKGSNLGVLIRAGLPVPPGFVVSAMAYRIHLDESNLGNRIESTLKGLTGRDIAALSEASREITHWFEEATMFLGVRDEIVRSYQNLCRETYETDVAVAVRSSATAEDLPSASFAGQQETFLGIRGAEAVLKHVIKCWASLWTPRAISYRIGMGFEHLKVDLAVVVQAMIASETAGVMFTANPVTGDDDEILVSASYGLGEAVVSGLVTPDNYVLAKDGVVKSKVLGTKQLEIVLTDRGTTTRDVPESRQKEYCLGDDELSQLAALAQMVEHHYGRPQDTEWAISIGKVYLVQARPITTIPAATARATLLGPNDEIVFKGKRPPFGFKDTMERFPEPIPPLDFAFFAQEARAFFRFMDVLGLKMPPQIATPIERPSGCVAVNLKQPGLSPEVLWKLPAFLLRQRGNDPCDLWKPVSAEASMFLAKMQTAERELGDAASIMAFLGGALDGFGLLVEKRFLAVLVSSLMADRDVSRWLKRAVRNDDVADLKASLYRALPFRTALQNQAIAQVAQTAASKGKESGEFRSEFNNLLKEYGHRPALGMLPMLSMPTWNEKPEFVTGLIDALMSDPGSLDWSESWRKQEADYAKARAKVESRLGSKQREEFRQALERARNGIIAREESLFVFESLTASLRRIVLKTGKLLVEKSVIDQVDDIFFLFISEIEPAAEDKITVRDLIERRKKAFAQVYAAHEQGQHWFISTGSFPDFVSKGKRKNETIKNSNVLKGQAASRGTCEGTACIVSGPSEFGKLKKDDILVAQFTAPAWTPLFRVACAVVTEIGSPVSHAAIVAREYGIPAVVAVDNVTKILRDGQKIRVDGTKGIVIILD